ncbi:MAG: trypsin-like serine protease [Gemmatimonadaceae bacterium]
MKRAFASLAIGFAAAITLLLGSRTAAAQVSVDSANRYANVGAIMVWRVDETGRPLQLLAFVSGTLIRDRVMVTAGHFTAPVKALGGIPPYVRVFASFSPSDARDRTSWIPVVRMATHPSMPHCPPPPQCDPTDDILVTPVEPGIADVGLVFLEHAPKGIEPARLADHGALERAEGTPMTIVGYGSTAPRPRGVPPDSSSWDGKRRTRTSTLRRVVDATWALWAIPSYVCHGDSGGAIFLHAHPNRNDSDGRLVANVSDGGRDCRRQNNNNRLDTPSIQHWINEAIREQRGER